MKRARSFLLFLMTLLGLNALAGGPSANCFPAAKDEKPLLREAQVITSKENLEKDFSASYNGAPRLKGRAFWDDSQRSFVIPYQGQNIKVPRNFLRGLQAHLALALKNQYADKIFYADLGHVHLLVATDDAVQLKTVSNPKERMEKVLSSPSLTALYHSAEMLQLKDGDILHGTLSKDPWKLWRYFSRNFVGSFSPSHTLETRWAGEKAIYNTVRGLPNKREVSALYFSANHAACFEFETEDGQKFFDITFETIPYL